MWGVRPLQYRGHPLWCFNGEDDATHCGCKGPDSAADLATILSELFKGEEEEFIHIKATGWIFLVQPSKLGELYLLTPILPAFFVVGTYLAILRQELRKAVSEVNSPSPQPKDPDRALGPGLEEDPDIFVELIDQQFYQLSCDEAMVAITADYPGLLPASHVRKIKNPNSKN